VRDHGLELSEALSRYVGTGIMSRNEARPDHAGRPDADELLQPVNIETVDQAQQRRDRTDAQAAAATATAANTNIAPSLTRRLDGLRPHAVDAAGGQLETAGIVAHLEDGREVVVDLADIRKALGGPPAAPLAPADLSGAAE
jgi:hypothetical protein